MVVEEVWHEKLDVLPNISQDVHQYLNFGVCHYEVLSVLSKFTAPQGFQDFLFPVRF